jgi:hypothetical protein
MVYSAARFESWSSTPGDISVLCAVQIAKVKLPSDSGRLARVRLIRSVFGTVQAL